MMRSRNLGDVVAGAPSPTSIALIDLSDPAAPREWSYDALDRAAAAVARGLVAHGAKRGERIAILAANRAEYLTTFLGTMRAGMVSVPINFKLPPAAIEHVLRDAGVSLVFVDRRAPSRGARRHHRCGPRCPRRLREPRVICDRRARGGRGRDDPLHLRFVGPAQGRAADPRRRAVDGRSAAPDDAGPVGRAPPRRRAALPHERAVDHLCRGVSRPGGRRHAAALLRARLHRSDRTPPLHVADRSPDDAGTGAPGTGRARRHRSLVGPTGDHRLGAAHPGAHRSHQGRVPRRAGDERLGHHRVGARRLRSPPARGAAAGSVAGPSRRGCRRAAGGRRRPRRRGGRVAGANARR